ncbi:MAG: hypothetical protein ACO2ZM_07990 [Francisellaceae bacterium]
MNNKKTIVLLFGSLCMQMASASQLLGVRQFNPLGDTLTNYDSAVYEASTDHNADGSIKQSVDYRKQTSQYDYDSVGRLQQKTTTASTSESLKKGSLASNINYSYYANSAQVKQVDNGSNSVSYTYTSSGKVSSVTTTPEGGAGYSIYYSYDPNSGQLLSKSDSDGMSESYKYGVNGLISDAVTDSSGATHTVSYQYDDYGRRSAILRDNSMNSYYSYDKQGRVAEIIIGVDPTTVSLSYSYSYNSGGNISQVVMVSNITDHSGTVTTLYGYNALNQLESASYSGDESLFPQDAFGSAMKAQYFSYTMNSGISTVKTIYTNGQYDLANYNYDTVDGYPDRLLNINHSGDYDYETSLKAHYSSGDYRYDDNGNIIQDPYGNQYSYNTLNQMIAMTSTSNSVNPVDVSYSYYPGGEMASERSNLLNSSDSMNNVPVYFYYSGQTDENGMHQLVDQKQGNQTNYIMPGLANILVDNS